MAIHYASAIHTNAALNMKSLLASQYRAFASLKRKPLFAYVHFS